MCEQEVGNETVGEAGTGGVKTTPFEMLLSAMGLGRWVSERLSGTGGADGGVVAAGDEVEGMGPAASTGGPCKAPCSPAPSDDGDAPCSPHCCCSCSCSSSSFWRRCSSCCFARASASACNVRNRQKQAWLCGLRSYARIHADPALAKPPATREEQHTKVADLALQLRRLLGQLERQGG